MRDEEGNIVYDVTIFAIGDDLRVCDLGTVRVPAKTEKDAERMGMDELWDDRLDSASCSPTILAIPVVEDYEDET